VLFYIRLLLLIFFEGYLRVVMFHCFYKKFDHCPNLATRKVIRIEPSRSSSKYQQVESISIGLELLYWFWKKWDWCVLSTCCRYHSECV